MKKIILIFTVLAFTCLSSECLAQKVTSQSVGWYIYTAVIDNAALPIGAIKTKAVLKTQKESNGQMKSHLQEDDINKKVSPRFAVARTDVKANGDAGNETMQWSDVLGACAAYKEGDSNVDVWRVPTNRELMLMFQVKGQLSTFVSDNYWSSTKRSNDAIWCVDFGNGGVLSYNVNNTPAYKHSVRCIMDL